MVTGRIGYSCACAGGTPNAWTAMSTAADCKNLIRHSAMRAPALVPIGGIKGVYQFAQSRPILLPQRAIAAVKLLRGLFADFRRRCAVRLIRRQDHHLRLARLLQ